MIIELSIVQREKKIDIHKERIISSTNQARGSRGDMLRTKPAKSSACLSPNGLRVKVSARLSSGSLRAKSLSQQKPPSTQHSG